MESLQSNSILTLQVGLHLYLLRVCIQLSLPEGVLVRLEGVCGERGEGDGRSSMHVQSISHWAPANIGPYSQAYSVSYVSTGP